MLRKTHVERVEPRTLLAVTLTERAELLIEGTAAADLVVVKVLWRVIELAYGANGSCVLTPVFAKSRTFRVTTVSP